MTKVLNQADETGLETLDLEKNSLRDAKHLRRIISARKGIAAAETELNEAVAAARAEGDTWAAIGLALDTSRQAAFQRFGRA